MSNYAMRTLCITGKILEVINRQKLNKMSEMSLDEAAMGRDPRSTVDDPVTPPWKLTAFQILDSLGAGQVEAAKQQMRNLQAKGHGNGHNKCLGKGKGGRGGARRPLECIDARCEVLSFKL